MKTIEPEYGFAAYCGFGTPRPFIHVVSTTLYARDVRRYMGKAWAHQDETWQQGWKRAYKAGWRVIRVRVEAAFLDKGGPA